MKSFILILFLLCAPVFLVGQASKFKGVYHGIFLSFSGGDRVKSDSDQSLICTLINSI